MLSRSPSSSQASKLPYGTTLLDALLLKISGPKLAAVAAEQTYTLLDLMGCHNVQPEQGCSAEKACETFVNEVLKGMNVRTLLDQELTPLKEATVSALVNTKVVRPAVTCYRTDDDTLPAIVIEIHSSPCEHTILKAILGGVDLVHVRKMFGNDARMTVFAFPKLPTAKAANRQCVKEITITWVPFEFRIELNRVCLEHVPTRLRDALHAHQPPHGLPSTRRVPVLLSTEELALFGTDANQLDSSGALLVKTNGHMFKAPLWDDEYMAMHVFSTRPLLGVSRHVSMPREVKMSSCVYFKYACVPHDPLRREEARLCLIELYAKVCQAVNELHDMLEMAHMDIRLDNICFSDMCDVVLIDFDRSVPVNKSCGLLDVRYPSCMFHNSMTPVEHDWRQVGWLLAWVLDSEAQDYHGRQSWNLPAWL